MLTWCVQWVNEMVQWRSRITWTVVKYADVTNTETFKRLKKKRSSHNQSKWNGIPPQWNWSLTSLKKVYHIHMFTIVSYKSTMLALIDEVIALPRYRRRTAPGIVVSFVTSRVSSSLNFVVSRFRILLMYQIQKQVNYLELDKPVVYSTTVEYLCRHPARSCSF